MRAPQCIVVTLLLSLLSLLAIDVVVSESTSRRHELYESETSDVSPREDGCAACITVVTFLQTLIRSDNATQDEIMDAVVDLCYTLFTAIEGWNPDELCQLAIDTYAPHIIYVFNVTNKTPAEICDLYNNCPHNNVTMWRPTPQHSGRRLQGPQQLMPPKADEYPNAIKIVHVTDIHADSLYAEGSPVYCDMPLCCREEYNGNGSAGYWGDYKCDIPQRTVDLMFGFIADTFNPDLVLCTGDTAPHSVWDQPFDETVAVNKFLTDKLAQYFPTAGVYWATGNHDTYPPNLFYIERQEIQELNAILFSQWQPVSKLTTEQQPTFERGLYYTISVRPGLRILSYNSNYGYLADYYNVLSVDEEPYQEMKRFMEDTLTAARTNNEKVIVMGHHPTGGSGTIREFSSFITNLQSQFADIIVLHLLGHSHNDGFTLMSDITTGVPVGVEIWSPSMAGYTDKNPSLRIIYLDDVTFQPLDMDTYHIDLNTDKDNPNPAINFIYRATTEYNMTDLSPAAFNDLINRMETDRSLLDKYRYNYETRVFQPAPCNDACAARELCDLRYSDYERRQQCHDNIAP